MEHPLRITLRKDGTTAIVSHPAYHKAIVRGLSEALGEVTKRDRAGHVYPSSFVLECGFRALRKLFSDSGRIAEWTRGWDCDWKVVLMDGTRLRGMFETRRDAIRAEVAYIERVLI